MNNTIYNEIVEATEQSGLSVAPATFDRIELYHGLIRKFNKSVSLVSWGDLENLWDHTADSLSLMPFCDERYTNWLDIGSGGGFPAFPLAIQFPGVKFTLIERSAKKVDFLNMSAGELGLANLEVVEGSFPDVSPQTTGIVTARAVEAPEVLSTGLGELIGRGAVFLCQSSRMRDALGSVFHVEQIDDEWSKRGLRRDRLWRVKSAK